MTSNMAKSCSAVFLIHYRCRSNTEGRNILITQKVKPYVWKIFSPVYITASSKSETLSWNLWSRTVCWFQALLAFSCHFCTNCVVCTVWCNANPTVVAVTVMALIPRIVRSEAQVTTRICDSCLKCVICVWWGRGWGDSFVGLSPCSLQYLHPHR